MKNFTIAAAAITLLVQMSATYAAAQSNQNVGGMAGYYQSLNNSANPRATTPRTYNPPANNIQPSYRRSYGGLSGYYQQDRGQTQYRQLQQQQNTQRQYLNQRTYREAVDDVRRRLGAVPTSRPWSQYNQRGQWRGQPSIHCWMQGRQQVCQYR